MKKIDVLAWGMKHIASNHGFEANVDYEEDGSMCVFGGCNVPTLADVQALCDDLGIQRGYVYASDFGVDVEIEWEWTQEGGLLQQEYYIHSGCETWLRYGVEIGS